MTYLPPRIKPDDTLGNCTACGKKLFRKYKESETRFARRETCNRSCANRARYGWDYPHEVLVNSTVVNPDTNCWEWQGNRDRKGYGRVAAKIDGEVMAHRVAYAIKYGPIPKGLHVLHACDNPRCVNVEHLSLGTNLDNVIDRVLKGRSACLKGEKNPNYRNGKYVKDKKRTPATVTQYWDWLKREYPLCVCGAPREHTHHIIHVNNQRITKDDWLVIGLCHACHNGSDGSVHSCGGEQQFLNATGWDLVHLAVLRRHNFEVRAK